MSKLCNKDPCHCTHDLCSGRKLITDFVMGSFMEDENLVKIRLELWKAMMREVARKKGLNKKNKTICEYHKTLNQIRAKYAENL